MYHIPPQSAHTQISIFQCMCPRWTEFTKSSGPHKWMGQKTKKWCSTWMMCPYAHTIQSQIILYNCMYDKSTEQSSVFRKILIQNMLNSVQTYNMTANLSDDELGEKIPVLFTDKYSIYLKKWILLCNKSKKNLILTRFSYSLNLSPEHLLSFWWFI